MSVLAYIELVPIAVVGVISGVVSLIDNLNSEEVVKIDFRLIFKIIKAIAISSFLCIIVYSMLSASDLPYLARVGISACIGFLGIDKALTLIREVLSFRKRG